MADIKIYGTLRNDTNEPIAYASQVYDAESGKNVKEMIAEAAAVGSSGGKEWITLTMSDFDASAPDNGPLPIDKDIIGDDVTGYQGIELIDDKTGNHYYLPFAWVYDDGSSFKTMPLTLQDGTEYDVTVKSETIELIKREQDDAMPEDMAEWIRDKMFEEKAGKYGVTMTVSPSSREFDGEDVEVHLTVRPTYDGAITEAKIAAIDGSKLMKQADGTYTLDATVQADASVSSETLRKSFSTTATFNCGGRDVVKNVSATLTQTVKTVIVSSDDVPSESEIQTSVQKLNSFKGTYTVNCTPGKYVWWCIPSGAANITSVKSGGFEVPMESGYTQVEVKRGGSVVTYKCVRTASRPQSESMNVTVQ